MSYEPASLPTDPKNLVEYLSRELRRLAGTLKDDAQVVQYRTTPATAGTLSAGISANYKIPAGNVVRLSTSVTVTLTGLALKAPNREVVLLNVGTGVLHLKNAATESSASYRFALVNSLDLSQNAACTLWYDGASARWRAIGRT
jgi:hypothetical protein